MSAKLVKEALSAKPFVPFELITAKGQVIRVKGPGLITFMLDQRSLMVCEGARVHHLPTDQITSIRSLPPT